MEFRAYLVKTNNNPALTIGLTGVIIFMFSGVFYIIKALNFIAPYVSVVGLCVAIVGAIFNAKKGMYTIETELLAISDNGVTIRSVFYAFTEISNLQLYYHSFYSQSSYGYYYENAGAIEYGIANRISFVYKGQEVVEEFALQNKEHADNFFGALNYLKEQGVQYGLSFRNYRR